MTPAAARWERTMLACALVVAGCSGHADRRAAGGRHDAGLRLVPDPALVTTQLAASIELPGVDPSQCRFVWRRDGNTIAAATTGLLEPTHFWKGARVSVEVTLPVSGSGHARTLTAETQVANAPPVVRSAHLRADVVAGGATIEANTECWDPDGDGITTRYRWFRNGEAIAGESEARLPILAFSRGDRIVVEVVASDGDRSSSPARSDAFVIQNRAPQFSAQTPAISKGESSVRFQALATDPDGDPVRYELVQAPAGMTIDAAGAVAWPLPPRDQRRDEYQVTIRAMDPNGGAATQELTIRLGAKDTKS